MGRFQAGKLLIVSILVCLFSSALVYIISIVNALDLAKLIPFVGLSKFNLNSLPLNLFDKSNDYAAELSAHELIKKAGFDYRIYYALADDGYMTQLIRIINPLADPYHLKSPVMVQHGQSSNSRNFVMQSNAQTFPMPWPRNSGGQSSKSGEKHNNDIGVEGAMYDKSNKITPVVAIDGEEKDSDAASDRDDDKFKSKRKELKTSSSRSLAFMLANNGYDVWLSSTRGVDSNNKGFFRNVVEESITGEKIRYKNMTEGEEQLLIKRTRRSYWSFTLDDQIAHEIPSQISIILNVTGANKITLIGYSNTALTTLAMLSSRKDIAPLVDTYVGIAPVVYYSKLDGWFKWFMEDFMQLIPKRLDAELFLSDDMAKFLRRTIARACSKIPVRYSMCKWFIDLLFGSSSQFRTNFEMPFFYHLLRPTSWKCLAQHLQIVKSHRLAKFDYGPHKNKRIYGTKQPPEYDISKIDRRVNLALISGENDSWANKATVEKIRRKLGRKLALDIVVPDYNHLDLTAAFDVDVKVNLPLLQFLDSRYYRQAAAAKLALQKRIESNRGEGDSAESSRSDENELLDWRYV